GGLSDGASALVYALRSPSVTRELDSFGKRLGDEGGKLAKALQAGVDSGGLAQGIDDALKAAQSFGDSMTAVLRVVGGIAHLWGEIPKDVRQTGIEALVYASILKRVAALSGGTALLGRLGVGGGTSAPATTPAAVRASVSGPNLFVSQNRPAAAEEQVRTFTGRLGGLRETLYQNSAASATAAAAERELAEARVAQTAALRANNTAQLRAAQAGNPATSWAAQWRAQQAAGTASQVQAAAQRVSAAEQGVAMAGRARAEASMQARGFGLSTLAAGLRSSGAIGAGLGGALSIATSGGDLKTGIASGAAAGALAGPWGIAGGAIAGAAGAAFVKYLHDRGEAAAKRL
ncbi:MAG: hypothetical protein AAGC46_17045, partial [Solirubrobacteraceae bacterium]